MDKTVTLTEKDLQDIIDALDNYISETFRVAISIYMKSANPADMLDTKLWQHYSYESRCKNYRLRCLKIKLENL